MKLANSEREVLWLYLAILLLVAGLYLHAVLPVLKPVFLFVALLLLAAPFSGHPLHRRFILTMALLLTLWFVNRLGSLLAPFILAFVLAYMLDPVVDRLQARGMKRPVAVAVLLVPLFAIMVITLVFGVPAVLNQAGDLIDRIPDATQKLIAWVQTLRIRLERMPIFRNQGFANALDSFNADRLAAELQARQAQIAGQIWGAVLGVGKGVTLVLSILGYVVLVPVLVIYLLVDFDRIMEGARSLMPAQARTRWMPLLLEYDKLLARYFRGQVIAALIVGVLTWLGLLITGFPYSGLVGAVAGIFNLVPYLGLIVSAIPAVLIAFLSGSVLVSLIKVGIVFGIVQLIDGTITGPRIVGGSVGLHPVWVILALAVGSSFFGFVGLLLAMPAGVLIKLLLREWTARYRASAVFQNDASADVNDLPLS